MIGVLAEWQNHVLKIPRKPATPQLGGEAWCGAEIRSFDWHYVDAGHAVNTVARGDRLSPCPACAQAIIDCLRPAVELGYAESWAEALQRIAPPGGLVGYILTDDDGNRWRIVAGAQHPPGWPEGLDDADTVFPDKMCTVRAPYRLRVL